MFMFVCVCEKERDRERDGEREREREGETQLLRTVTPLAKNHVTQCLMQAQPTVEATV